MFILKEPIAKLGNLNVFRERKREVEIKEVLPVTDEEYRRTNEALSRLKNKPVVLSCVAEHAHHLESPTHNVVLPNSLTSLYNPLFEDKSTNEVNEECERLMSTLSISKEEQLAVNLVTRDQSLNEEWIEQRSGRLTGTKIARICKRDMSKTELSSGEIQFVLEICNPELVKFTGNKNTR